MPVTAWCGGPVPVERLRSPQVLHWRSETDTSRPVYALTRLSFFPHGRSFEFAVGDRLEENLPADVLKACIARGEAAYHLKPKKETTTP